MSIDPVPTTPPQYDDEYDHQHAPMATHDSGIIDTKTKGKTAMTAEEVYTETLKANHEAEMKKLDALSLRLMEDEERSERQWKAMLRLMKDTNRELDRTMAGANGSSGRTGSKVNAQKKRDADKVAIAKAKR